MKKTLALAVALVLGLAFSAYGQVKEIKQTEKVKGATTTETTTVKTQQGGTAKETVTTNVNEPGKVETKTELKGKKGEFKRTTTETPGTVAGETKVNAGSIKDLDIDWTYSKVMTTSGAPNYIITYDVKKNKNPKLAQELGLTPAQADAIKLGKHTITSTSEFTAADVQNNFRAQIIKHLKATTPAAQQ